MRGRSRAGRDAEIGKQSEADIGVERRIADGSNVDTGDAAAIQLAPIRQTLVIGKILRGNPETAQQWKIVHVP